MAEKIALITGITGQDGSYLTELLFQKGYAVHGIVRRTSNLLRSRIEHLRRDPKIYGKTLFLHYGDLSETTTLRRIFRKVGASELYHLAGESHVGLSFELPESTCDEAGMPFPLRRRLIPEVRNLVRRGFALPDDKAHSARPREKSGAESLCRTSRRSAGTNSCRKYSRRAANARSANGADCWSAARFREQRNPFAKAAGQIRTILSG